MWRSRLPILVNRMEEAEKRRITQQEIAEATKLRQPTISAWMNWGTFKRLDAGVVAKLAAFFNCNPEDLYEWVDNEHPEVLPGRVTTAPAQASAA